MHLSSEGRLKIYFGRSSDLLQQLLLPIQKKQWLYCICHLRSLQQRGLFRNFTGFPFKYLYYFRFTEVTQRYTFFFISGSCFISSMISIQKKDSNVEFSIFDMHGQKVCKADFQISEGKNNLKIHDYCDLFLSPGVYFLHIQSGNREFQDKTLSY